jgi:hypothetical protein
MPFKIRKALRLMRKAPRLCRETPKRDAENH